MIYRKSLLLVIVLITCALSPFARASSLTGYPRTNRVKENINLNWKFAKDNEGQPTAVNFDDSGWQEVSLPHNPDPVSIWLDSATNHWSQKDFIRDKSWYRKEMIIELESNEKAFLEFEGVHSATELWVNGQHVGRYAVNGYIPHHFDITDFVESGKKNVIVVLADHSFDPTIAPDPHQSDYVRWGGIYRDVYLVKTNKLHVNFNWESMDAGVHITTPTVKKNNGTVSVKTTVVNEYDEAAECRIETMIVDADGYVLQKMKSSIEIPKGQSHSFRQTTEIEDNYRLWSPDSPYLYRAVSVIYLDNEPVDFIENKFGFRSIALVDGKGFMLNGEPFFMVGVNRHQNYPHIGDAVPNSMHYEAALRYKKAGMNAVRLSHYPQDNSFIEACDELGILLYEEPSTWVLWEQGEWMNKLEQSARVMIRNHRNHPSIVIWGAGINHRGPVPQLNNAAKEEDPYRLTASASSPWCGTQNAGVTDIYATMDYRRTQWPESDFCLVMEHGYSNNGLGMQFHISRYKKRNNNIGALLWVGADYNRLRENENKHDMFTEYGLQTAYRIPRPSYYWYKSEFADEPFVHIADESVYKNRKIHVYSNANEVALYADGKLVTTQNPDNDNLRNQNEHPSFTFNFDWKEEKLTAKALYNGKVRAEHSRIKVGAPYALKLAIDNSDLPLVAGGSDLKMLRAYVVDRNGEVVTDADERVSFSVQGAGEILYSDKSYIQKMQTYHGVATVYLKGASEAGEIKIKASAGKLKSRALLLNSIPFESDMTVANGVPIYDYTFHKIDLQNKGQLLQFGWTCIGGGDEESFSFDLDKSTFTVSGDSALNWRPGTWTMVGDLGYVASDGIFVKGGILKLTIKDLPKGRYKLKTYHHSFEKRKGKLYPYNMRVTLDDAKGDFEYVSDEEPVGIQSSSDIGERKPVSVTNFIESDGNSPVELTFQTDKDNAETWLNGLEFRKLK